MSHPLFPARAILPLAMLTALAGLASGTARAQVTTDDSALSTLAAPRPSEKSTAKPGTLSARHPRHTAPATPGTTSPVPSRPPPSAASALPVAAAAPPPIPARPPNPPVIPPPVVDVPLHPPAPPPETVAVAGATGTVGDRPGGLRLTFAPGSADMNAAMIERVKDFAATVLQAPWVRAEIDATASGTPDDVSTPRRVSLSRGLAIRSILIHAGVASTRIYVRAIGLLPQGASPDITTTTDPDHVDVTRSDMVASPTRSGASSSAPSGAPSGPHPPSSSSPALSEPRPAP
jgi:hypothetical protein